MISYLSTVCMLPNVMQMFVQLHLPLDVRRLIRKHLSKYELSSVFVCTLVVRLLHNDCLYCVWLSVTCKYAICVRECMVLVACSHNPVSSTVCYIHWFVLHYENTVTMINVTMLLNSRQNWGRLSVFGSQIRDDLSCFSIIMSSVLCHNNMSDTCFEKLKRK